MSESVHYPISQKATRGATDGPASDGFELRAPQPTDASAMWELVRDSSLDTNSPYAYLMLAHYFSETCVVADRGGELSGFVSGFVPPDRHRTLFVWQVGVCDQARGYGLATRLIATALQRETCQDVAYVEATVTPSNAASLALFRGLAEKLGTHCRETTCFPAHLFPGAGHEEELLLRIGPFDRSDLARLTHTLE